MNTRCTRCWAADSLEIRTLLRFLWLGCEGCCYGPEKWVRCPEGSPGKIIVAVDAVCGARTGVSFSSPQIPSSPRTERAWQEAGGCFPIYMRCWLKISAENTLGTHAEHTHTGFNEVQRERNVHCFVAPGPITSSAGQVGGPAKPGAAETPGMLIFFLPSLSISLSLSPRRMRLPKRSYLGLPEVQMGLGELDESGQKVQISNIR